MSNQESAFYQSDDGPEEVWNNGGRYSVERVGEMLIIHTDTDGNDHYIRTTEDLAEIGITTDAQLAAWTAKGDDVFHWRNNSWFEIYDNETNRYTEDVYHELDEAVERAIHLNQRESN